MSVCLLFIEIRTIQPIDTKFYVDLYFEHGTIIVIYFKLRSEVKISILNSKIKLKHTPVNGNNFYNIFLYQIT